MKNKKNVDKPKKLNNPLEGIPTKSLLITLIALLLTFGLGFGSGFGCRSVSVSAAELSSSVHIVKGSISRDLVFNSTPVYPAFRPISGSTIAPNSFVGVGIIGNGVATNPSQVAQLFVVNGDLFTLTFPSSTLDVGTVPSFVSNRSFVLTSYSVPASGNASSRWNITVPFYDGSTFDPVWGTSFRSGSSGNPIEYAYSIVLMSNTNAPIKTTSALNSAVLTYGLPTYALPLFGFYSTRNTPYVVNPLPSQSVSFSGLRFVLLTRFYFGTFEGFSLPDNFADIYVEIYTNEYNTLNSFNAQLFGVQYDGLIDSASDSVLDNTWSQGYQAGLSQGYDNGFSAGTSQTLEDVTPWQHIVNAVNSFIRLELLPGVPISTILSITFGAILIGFLLKFYLGG